MVSGLVSLVGYLVLLSKSSILAGRCLQQHGQSRAQHGTAQHGRGQHSQANIITAQNHGLKWSSFAFRHVQGLLP
jgi:hypothetical protein